MAPEPLHRALGLTDDEFERIRATLGRDPNRNELAMYGVMWSEHCSYKSSRIYLRELPAEGPSVLVGPGQDAGVVDVGDGLAVAFKMQSHSHSSALEPYQGAATGVGGVVRDIVAMGARPIASLDPLMFGPLSEERNRRLFEGVVAGIGGYGNCIGVPTVGGEVKFAEPHSLSPTINVMCVGVAPVERLVTSTREVHEGSFLVLFGASTGRDGIGGVSVLASRTLEEGSEENHPSVQIGDPFAEKLLIEVSLELVARDLLEGLRDLGAAGITCAVSESAARAGLGVELDLDAVPLRAPDLEALEILTSESQERMLAIVEPSKLDEVMEVCGRWGLASPVVGRLVAGGGLRVVTEGVTVADVPARSLADEGPEYDRPIAEPAWLTDLLEDDPTFTTVTAEPRDAFLAILSSPNVASKRWVFEQYDQLVQGGTVLGPGADAAVVRIEGTLKGLALSTDGKGRFGFLDPYLGAAHAVAEAARNVATVGATPLAITNCLNFGNPERSEVMWQLAGSIRGMADACRALETPVTGGDVSFYDESGTSAIWPTPVIGMLGLLPDHRFLVRPGFRPGYLVYVLGETFPELGGSEFAEVVLGKVTGRPPALDLERERALQQLLVEAARSDLLASAHDCSDGGLAVTLAESAIAGEAGFAIALPGDLPWYATLFSESASRAVVSIAPEKIDLFETAASAHGVPFARVGETGGPRMVFDTWFEVAVEDARVVYEGTISRLLAGVSLSVA